METIFIFSKKFSQKINLKKRLSKNQMCESNVGCFILLYVNDKSYSDNHFKIKELETEFEFLRRTYPICDDNSPLFHKKYPCMCLINRKGTCTDLSGFVSERRGLYKKWQSGERDPQDYMYVYRYIQQNGYSDFIVNAVIVGYYSTEQTMLDLLSFYERTYLTFYKSCFVPENIKTLEKLKIKKKIPENIVVLPMRVLCEKKPDPPSDTRTARQRYRDTHREKIKETNRAYYLKKKANENTANIS